MTRQRRLMLSGSAAIAEVSAQHQHEAMKRASCAYFASHMLLKREDPKDSAEFQVARHHLEWDGLLQNHDRLCVLAHRDSGKSYFFDFAFPIWRANYEPNGRGFIFSASQDQSVRILTDIKDEIEDNPLLQHLLPPSPRELWNATSIKLANGHRIYARGFGTKVRGAHPQWIVVDDGLNDEDAYSEVVRNKHINYFFSAVSNMIVPGGQLVVVGTPLHPSDLYFELERNAREGRGYHFQKFPALDRQGRALWPARYDEARLEAKRKEIGAIRFTREFQLEPISDDMSLFPGSLFQGDPVEQYHVRLSAPLAHWRKVIGIKSVYIGVDLAISASTGADYTVVFVLGLDAMGNRWVMDIIREKGMSFQKQLSVINRAARRYEADLVFIESNQMQRVFGDELIRTTDLPIRKFVTTGTGKAQKGVPKGNTESGNKNSLEGGVPSLRLLLENGKVRIPRGDARSVSITDEWITEMRAFTWVDGKLQGVGAHDDTVLAFWIADQAVRRGGFSFSTGDEADMVEDVGKFMREMTEEPEVQARRPGDDEYEDVVQSILAPPDPAPLAPLPPSSVSLMDDADDVGVSQGVSSPWSALTGALRR